jgi:hypothetical protein
LVLGHFLDTIYSIPESRQKLIFKGNTFTGIDQLLNPENNKSVNAAWKNSLARQIICEVSEYDMAKNILAMLFNKIFEQK